RKEGMLGVSLSRPARGGVTPERDTFQASLTLEEGYCHAPSLTGTPVKGTLRCDSEGGPYDPSQEGPSRPSWADRTEVRDMDRSRGDRGPGGGTEGQRIPRRTTEGEPKGSTLRSPEQIIPSNLLDRDGRGSI